MSLSETTTIEQASDWSAEKLVAEMTTCESGQIGDVMRDKRDAVMAFLSAEGKISFGFNELIHYIGDTLPLKGNEEQILRIMACLFMRLDIEEMRDRVTDRTTSTKHYGAYRRGLENFNIAPPITISPQRNTATEPPKWSWWNFLTRRPKDKAA